MKIFVTGGTGFIGVPLIRELLGRGHEVRGLARNPEEAEKLGRECFPGGAVRWHRGDLLDEESLARGMAGCEAAFHLAGAISYRHPDRAFVRRVNREGTRAVVRAALQAGVSRLVHTSSIVAVGMTWDPSRPLTEASPFNAGELGMEYPLAKHLAEVEVADGVRKGLDAVIVNPATVAGFTDHAGRDGNVKDAVRLLSRIPFLLPGGGCWVDVRDVISGHLLAFEKGRRGERYILGGENISNADVTRRLARAAGRRAPRLHLPGGPVKLLGRLVRAAESVGVPIPIGSQVATRVSGFYMYFDCTKAKTELGWRPVSPWAAMEAMVRA